MLAEDRLASKAGGRSLHLGAALTINPGYVVELTPPRPGDPSLHSSFTMPLTHTHRPGPWLLRYHVCVSPRMWGISEIIPIVAPGAPHGASHLLTVHLSIPRSCSALHD